MSSADYKRVILVTGSNDGIGLQVVRQLAEKGHTVYLSARREAAGLEAQASIKSSGDVKFVLLDVTSTESIAAAKDVIEKAEGRLDSLVHNAAQAGLARMGGALAEPLDSIRASLETNLIGAIAVTQAFVPLLRKAPKGVATITFVMSDMASNSHMSSPKGHLHEAVAYNTSKAAAASYAISLSKALEGEIKVNAVTPGFTTTKLNGHREGGRTPTQGAATIVPVVLLGPEDEGKTCKFIWNDGSEHAW
ncbi:NAD(P)-binding protein [Cylindrobasidium torrendii FP15055 ss-10]|uniref:NAD(P)-binding protein n=1 Tax=Cylindrobasidium torrendii FP15055 ss-10 TaxID=1314674 RepID=A0A0D7B4S3_9AGAR|nr:NAD(P)-binding protein [Cylindrobasidium torrendii FP15055 ss-10]